MNDFTKEQLQQILFMIIEYANIASLNNNEDYIGIKDKLKSMLYNYCEHYFVFYISPLGNAVRCQNCNKGITE